MATAVQRPRPFEHKPEPTVLAKPARRATYVWELPVRITHWTIVIGIVVLSLTGYYIHHPFLSAAATNGANNPGFLLATMRFIHEITAFVFITAFLLRIYWAFAGNRYAHWRALVPLRGWQREDLGRMFRYYALIRRHPSRFNGHNPLAGLAYLGLYVGFLIEILTGLALFAWLMGRAPWTTLFGWPYQIVSIQSIRLVHLLMMFAFIAFAIHHVYSAVLIDLEEHNGELSSIVTGWKADVQHDEEPARVPRDDPERSVT